MRDHMRQLQQVTGTTKSLVDLLVAQIRALEKTVPVGRGFEIVRFSSLLPLLHLSGIAGG